VPHNGSALCRPRSLRPALASDSPAPPPPVPSPIPPSAQMDTEFIAEQARVKALAAGEAAAAGAADRAETAAAVAAVAELERRQAADARALTKSVLADLTAQIAARESRDSWPLNDPKRVLKAPPARVGDDDPRLGPSSAQVFAGEDVMFPARKALQQAQMRAWVAQVSAERAAGKAAEAKEDAEFMATALAAAAAADAIEKETAGIGKGRDAAAAAANLAAIADRAARRAADRAGDAADDAAHCSTLVTPGAGMGVLAEDYGDGVSALGPHRIRPGYYRGRPPAYGEKVREAYLAQMAEKAAGKAAAAARDDALAVEYAAGVRAAAKLERAQAAAAAAARAEARAALDAQRAEQAAARAAERAAHKAPGFGKEYFEAFGKP
jgi:hypothetical protein